MSSWFVFIWKVIWLLPHITFLAWCWLKSWLLKAFHSWIHISPCWTSCVMIWWYLHTLAGFFLNWTKYFKFIHYLLHLLQPASYTMHINTLPSSVVPTQFIWHFFWKHLHPVYFRYQVHFLLFSFNQNSTSTVVSTNVKEVFKSVSNSHTKILVYNIHCWLLGLKMCGIIIQ